MNTTLQKAGGILLRTNALGERELFVIHRPRYDDWSLPKGHIDEGESPEDAAIREIREETGMQCHVETDLPDYIYQLPDGTNSVVKMFMCETIDDKQTFAPEDSEVDTGQWMSVEEAVECISYPSLSDYLESTFELGLEDA